MKVRITKERLEEMIVIKLPSHPLVYVLEGELVEEYAKVGTCPSHGNELCTCVYGHEGFVKGKLITSHPQPIEEIDIGKCEDVFFQSAASQILEDKLNELIRLYNAKM